MTFTDLNEPERLLWRAFPRGTWVDMRAGDPVADELGNANCWGPGRVIRAEVIRALLLGAGDIEPGYAPGVRLRGARITGRLDLMGACLAHPLVCEYCRFDEELRFVEATTRTVRIVSSHLPAFNGTRMRLDGIFNLWASEIAGVLRLEQAKLTGHLCLVNATIGTAAAGTEALAAFGLAVDGSVECDGLEAQGTVSMQVAAITGSLDLTGAQVICRGQRALAMDRAVIGGRLDCRYMTVVGETRMHNSRVGTSVVLTGARLDNPGGVALGAGGLTAGGGVFLTEGFTAMGEVRLIGARLGANLTLSDATLKNPDGTALNLDRAKVNVCHGANLTCEGQVTLVSTQIASDLDLRDAHFTGNKAGPALDAEHASIDGALILTRSHAHGEVSLRTIRVGQRILLNGSQLENRGQIACRLSRAQVAADVFCDGMTSAGGIRVAGAAIGGELSFKSAQIRNAGDTALDASALQAGELSLQLAEPVQGMVDLSHAHIKILRDDPTCWPDKLRIDGLTYQALEPPLPARQRLQWLDKDPRGHQPQPYEQLAAYYTAIGQPAQARQVMYAREHNQHQSKTLLTRASGLLQDVTVGYGYKPWRALVWLAILLAAGSLTFAIAPPPPLQASAAPHFNPVVYTLDLLLPVVDLGQKHAFNPAGLEQWFSYLLIAAGWVLVTTVAAGAARVLSRR